MNKIALKHFKGEPSEYILRYRDGDIRQHGIGMSFWYWPFNTTIAAVPVVRQDALFVFTETTTNYQEISIQGQLTYRLAKPLEVARVLDFTIDPQSRSYRSQDPEKLVQRVINAVQANTRSGVNALSLEDALVQVKQLGDAVLAAVQQEPDLVEFGVVVENLHFSAVNARPDMHKALEANYRESLQQRSDAAIYARRKAAQEEEGQLKHRELDTEVELEDRRRGLVEQQSQNRLTEAETAARAMELEASARAKEDEIRFGLYQSMSPQALVGLALKEWAGSAGKVENLTITPDLLNQVVQWIGRKEA
ncbi:MAG: SPFH domain-containing protein [Gammaproteobacteria bacterium]|nr:SPFH domain-containing protein [Gammaproteobacteria bacterium]MDH3559847.1 SPFH domain-containing protein [Gammaproteobacteria bacterium]